MKITPEAEKSLRIAFEKGYKSNIIPSQGEDAYIRNTMEQLIELHAEGKLSVEDSQEVLKQINLLKKQANAYRAGMEASLLTNNIHDINGEFSMYLESLQEEKKSEMSKPVRRTPLAESDVKKVLGIQRQGLTKQQIVELHGGYRNPEIRAEVQKREIRRPTTGEYGMSNKAKIAIGLLALGATLALANIAASHAEELPQENLEAIKQEEQQDKAKEFRESMKLGENSEYNYINDTIQINEQTKLNETEEQR